MENMYASGLQNEQALRNILINTKDDTAKNNYQNASSDFRRLITESEGLVANGPADSLKQLEAVMGRFGRK